VEDLRKPEEGRRARGEMKGLKREEKRCRFPPRRHESKIDETTQKVLRGEEGVSKKKFLLRHFTGGRE